MRFAGQTRSSSALETVSDVDGCGPRARGSAHARSSGWRTRRGIDESARSAVHRSRSMAAMSLELASDAADTASAVISTR